MMTSLPMSSHRAMLVDQSQTQPKIRFGEIPWEGGPLPGDSKPEAPKPSQPDILDILARSQTVVASLNDVKRLQQKIGTVRLDTSDKEGKPFTVLLLLEAMHRLQEKQPPRKSLVLRREKTPSLTVEQIHQNIIRGLDDCEYLGARQKIFPYRDFYHFLDELARDSRFIKRVFSWREKDSKQRFAVTEESLVAIREVKKSLGDDFALKLLGEKS